MEILLLFYHWCAHLVGRNRLEHYICCVSVKLYMHPPLLLWYGWDISKRKRWVSIA